jgi:glycosyltransferase involved in cell wall biosynthesis
VSVVIPAFDSATTIGAAIESVLGQTRRVDEILVVDDGSRDDTAAIAEAYGPPVRVVRKRNGGTASARNAGVREAAGDVVTLLDADDAYRATHVQEIVETLEARPDLDAVLTDAEYVSPAGSSRCGDFWPAHASRDILDVSASVTFCAIGVRKRALLELGPFDARFRILEDVEFWHRLICRGYRVGYVDSASYVYRVHEASKSQSGLRREGEWELTRVNLRYALDRRTPHRFRPRLAVRALRHARAAAAALVRG